MNLGVLVSASLMIVLLGWTGVSASGQAVPIKPIEDTTIFYNVTLYE